MAKALCELEQWKNSGGEFCLASARKALPKIANKAGFSLPPSKPMVTGISCGAGSVEVAADFPDNRVSCRIEELRDISLEIAGDKDKSRWRSMMASHHPRGWSRTPGKQIDYWIKSASRGALGGIGFCAASWHQGARDKRIGWSQRARARNLEYVVNNHRFLLLPVSAGTVENHPVLRVSCVVVTDPAQSGESRSIFFLISLSVSLRDLSSLINLILSTISCA